MPPPANTAVLDANVLHSNHLRNLLLQMAQNDVFVVRWSEKIEEEWLRNMERAVRERITAKTFPLRRRIFPDALIRGFDPEREVGSTHWKDGHVASASAKVAPCVLVTSNLKDFDFVALDELQVTVLSPDAFLTKLFDESPALVDAVTREAAANLTRTLPSWEEYLAVLSKRTDLVEFVDRLRPLDLTSTLTTSSHSGRK
ncbi:hypothetical protein [Rhodopseudomonas sp. WA056]|uniref:hypothetical protein n=1 Tax=Rhodopseudomonas sp. WA056 TaxID=2269367 RepID=UPI0013E07B87|nr:hypothetical protein [Rhodopseudomonas sp. WA056]